MCGDISLWFLIFSPITHNSSLRDVAKESIVSKLYGHMFSGILVVLSFDFMENHLGGFKTI